MRESIFVSIPSYSDPDLPATIDSAIRMSSGRVHIGIGVCEQVSEYAPGWMLGRSLPGHVSVRLSMHGLDVLGLGGARSDIEKLYRGETYVLMIDAHMRFLADWDVALIECYSRLPAGRTLISTLMPADPWNSRYAVPVGNAERFYEEPFEYCPAYEYHLLEPSDRGAYYPSRFTHGGSTFGRSWFHEVPEDPYIAFMGEEPWQTARLWTSGYDTYHAWMPVMHGSCVPAGRPWERQEFHDFEEVSFARLRHVFGLSPIEDSDHPALADLDRYGVGKERSWDDWIEWSGFDYVGQVIRNPWP